jgi:hypothetical protein
MEKTVKAQLRAACRHLLRPIVRVLVKSGMSWKEFAELAKSVFVDVVSDEYGKKGRPANISRVAILTGLSRHEVRKQRALPTADEAEAELTGFLTRGARVLSGWHQDKDFLDDAGRPRDLPLDGRGITFADLSRRYGGDIPVVAMLKELKAADAVVETAERSVRVLKRAYIPQALSPERVRLWGSVLHDIGETIEHNMTRTADVASRFERRATGLRVDRSALPAFRRFLESEGQALLEQADRWLSEHSVKASAASDRRALRGGVGIYEIRERLARRKSKAT